jgi:large subunit ribosomal protein L15
MKLEEILAAAGKNKKRKRVGRGDGSGKGKTSGRGHKGYKSRSGAKQRLGYEGGQNPMLARIPQRGFNNKNFRTAYQVVNLASLEEAFDAGSEVDVDALVKAHLVRDAEKPVKILGDGELTKKLNVKAMKFSKSAVAKITAAGGQALSPDGTPVASEQAEEKDEQSAAKAADEQAESEGEEESGSGSDKE